LSEISLAGDSLAGPEAREFVFCAVADETKRIIASRKKRIKIISDIIYS